MKKIFLLVISICLCFSVFAQKNALKSVESIKYEGVITQVETPENFIRLQVESPSKLLAVYYEMTHFCYISDKLPENAQVKGELCNFVSPSTTCDDANTLISTKEINHRKYRMVPGIDTYNAYAIGNSGYYVIVYPKDVIAKGRIAFMKEYGY